MVSFRLSADEYDRLREFCFAQGVRSVSELARVGISMLLQQPSRAPQEIVESRLSEMEGRLQRLSLEVRRLNSNPRPMAVESTPARAGANGIKHRNEFD